MLTVNKLIPQGRGLAGVLLKRAAHVELDWDTRQKSRFDATDSAGRALCVGLPDGSVLRGGDVLVAEDGTLIRVQAAAQPVLTVRACAEHGSPLDLARAAYHLGTRQAALELHHDHLKLQPDAGLATLLRRMHLDVAEGHDAFEPEAGSDAAEAEHAHGHDHGHEHGHGCSHGHGHAHEHAHAEGHAHGGCGCGGGGCGGHGHDAKPAAVPVHVHGPGCRHGHGHGA